MRDDGSLRRSCWQPTVKGLTLMVNSVFNSYRFEDIWLDI
jgi:peptide/nickel transport system substrate-binding protein